MCANQLYVTDLAKCLDKQKQARTTLKAHIADLLKENENNW